MAERGVYRIPWLSERGEAMLVAIDHRHWEVGERICIRWTDDAHGMDAAIEAATDALWDRLDTIDPMRNLELFHQEGADARP
jgi:hypothetical protein